MQFRLASVLSLREAQLSQTSQEVSRLEVRAQTIDNTCTEIDEERGNVQAQTAPAHPILAADLHLAAEYLKALDRETNRLRAEGEQVRHTLDDTRTTLVIRHQAVTVLKNLRARLAEVAALDFARREQRALDEVAGTQAHRRKTT